MVVHDLMSQRVNLIDSEAWLVAADWGYCRGLEDRPDGFVGDRVGEDNELIIMSVTIKVSFDSSTESG